MNYYGLHNLNIRYADDNVMILNVKRKFQNILNKGIKERVKKRLIIN